MVEVLLSVNLVRLCSTVRLNGPTVGVGDAASYEHDGRRCEEGSSGEEYCCCENEG